MSTITQKRPLFIASPEHCFWVVDGTIIKDLVELKQVVKKMDRKTFSYHVNKEKNDFARWVGDILQDGVLAEKLAKVKTKTDTMKVINNHLKENYNV